MAENERNYVVPLRQYWRMAPRYKRAKRAVNGIRRFVIRHMKVEQVLIGKELNEFILERGQRKPPARVQVTIIKENNVGKVNVIGVPYSKEMLKVDKGKKGSLKKTSEKDKKEEVKEEHKNEGHEHKHIEESKANEVKEEKPKAKKVAKKKESSE